MIDETDYIELMKNCSKWNSKIMKGRKKFVYDQQTGIVHRPSNHLYRDPSERQIPDNPMQVYTYPPIKWVKPKATSADSVEMGFYLRSNPVISEVANSMLNAARMNQQFFTDGASSEQPGSSGLLRGNNSRTTLYERDQDAGGVYDFDDYISDEEDWGSSRKKRKKTVQSGGTPGIRGKKTSATSAAIAAAAGIGNQSSAAVGSANNFGRSTATAAAAAAAAQQNAQQDARLYICQACGAKYKSRAGLTYHRIHVHEGNVRGNGNNAATSNSKTEGSSQSVPTKPTTTTNSSPPVISPKITISNYCDFCLGGKHCNADGDAEELVSCHDCGRSGHPTCLKFTANMLISVKRHGWQCIECKSCTICGTSENDDQLLFCDDCDKGFHLYCLTPALKSPPESDWSCHLCVQSFGAEASINKPQASGSGSDSNSAANK